jgi:hypothetical protein
MTKAIDTPVFRYEIDTRGLSKNTRRVTRAMRLGVKAVGEDYAKRIHEGFKKEGIDPASARGKYWAPLVIPSGMTRKGGRTKRGKILKKTGAYLKSTHPSLAKLLIRVESNTVSLRLRYNKLPPYAKYHEQEGNAAGFTTQVATAKQAAFLRYLGYRGVWEGTVITLPARRVFVYPPSWRGVHARLFARVFKREFENA